MLQVYTGDGKGKTTAAIGLSIRALGAGLNVYFGQFMKSLSYSEQKILQKFAPQLKLVTSGKPYFIAEEGSVSKEVIEKMGDKLVVYPQGQPPREYVALVKEGIKRAKETLQSKKYDLIVLDEINVALYFGLASRAEVESLLDGANSEIEIVCTGRKAPSWLLERADLITQMDAVRHYFEKGVAARKGIED